jgi:hypothetical protein
MTIRRRFQLVTHWLTIAPLNAWLMCCKCLYNRTTSDHLVMALDGMRGLAWEDLGNGLCELV